MTAPTSATIQCSHPTPNMLVDVLMPLLTSEEIRVYVWVTRHILGFEDRRITHRRCLSVSVIQNGYGSYPGCGLGRGAIINAIKGLTAYRVLLKIGDPTPQGQEYELPVEEKGIDLAGLMHRLDTKTDAPQRATAKARAAKAQRHMVGLSDEPKVSPDAVFETDQSEMLKQSVEQTDTGLSNRLSETAYPVCQTDQDPSVEQTDTGLSNRQNQSNSQSNSQSNLSFASSPDDARRRFFDALAFSRIINALIRQALDQQRIGREADALRKQQNAAVASIIAAWVEANNIIVVQTDKQNNPYINTTNRESALALHQAGVTTEDVRDFITERKTEDYWKTKTLSFSTILKDIASWKAAQQPAPVPTDDDWDDEIPPSEDGEERIEMPDYIRRKFEAILARDAEYAHLN